MFIHELVELIARRRAEHLFELETCRQPLPHFPGGLQRSAIDECGYSAENQVAAKIVVVENRPGYLCLDGVVEGGGGSVGRR
jgi:hypothetical protein